MSSLSILIPAAGFGRRMKSYGPKSLIDLFTGETIISRQLSILSRLYPLADIVIVTGFESDKLCKHIPSNVRIVENEFYETTNVARSIAMGLRAITSDRVLLVYGDTVFDDEAVVDTGESHLVLQPTPKKDEVGIIFNKYAENLQYDATNRWGQIALLANRELELFRHVCYNKSRNMCYGFEIINEIIDMGARFHVVNSGFVVDIDSFRDLDYTKHLSRAGQNARVVSRIG